MVTRDIEPNVGVTITMKMLHDNCNMWTVDLTDMYACMHSHPQAYAYIQIS